MHQQGSSINGVLALILGLCGIAFLFLGCFCGPFALLAPICSLLAVVLASLEMSRINQGLLGEANRATATTGGILGGVGCLIQLVYWCFIGSMFVLYLFVAVLAAVAGV